MNADIAKEDLRRRLRSERLVAIIRTTDAATATGRATDLLAAGASLVEISLSTPQATNAISEIASSSSSSTTPSALIGVGTVLTVEQLHLATDAGAQFTVTPTTNVDVLRAAHQCGMPIIAGAATPTEIDLAISHGAAAVKLFPASLWTLQAFTDLRQVFPDVAFVPTGGIDADRAKKWIDAGAAAVGLGSALTSPDRDISETIDALRSHRSNRG